MSAIRSRSTSTRTRRTTTGLVAACAILVAGVASRTAVQAKAAPRGVPHDWSHRHVIASQFGPDNGAAVSRDWRTYFKHTKLEQARQARLARGSFADWLNTLAGGKHTTTATDDATHLDWSLQTGGFGSVVGDPAKYSFDMSTWSCSDVIYFSVDQAGAASTVNVIAITNAYASCPGNSTGTTPTVKFGIRLGTGTATSIVPSLDGSVIYVFESRTAGNGGVILHAINVNNITTNVGTYNFGTKVWSNAHSLAAPTGLSTSEQLFQVTFAGTSNNVSSPYLDYDNNQIFFGDSAGKIHRVKNVNTTAAAEDKTTFPVSCGTAQLTSPVFVNGQVIVTSANGFLYRIDTTKPTPYSCIASVQGGAGTAFGASGGLASPVVDITNNQIIVVTGHDANFGYKGIGTFNLMFAAGENYTSGAVIGAADGIAPQTPTMDDDFWTNNSGSLYVPGSPMAGGDTYLVRLPYNGLVGTAAGYAALHHSGVTKSSVQTGSVTEFLTGSSLSNPDFIFVGGRGGAYLFMNRISSNFAGADTAPVAVASSFAVPGGVASGVVIDTNSTSVTGATAKANIYFGTVGIASTTQSTIVQLAQQF
jgi:hypothetical protein